MFLREALTRLSGRRGAWVWLLLEPVAHVAILMLMFSTLRERAMPGGLNFALYLAIGLLGFGLFRTVANRSMGAVAANQALFAYRQGKPIDAVLVRIFLEGILQLLVAVVLLTGASMLGLKILLSDPLSVVAAWMLLWLLGAGLGLMLSVGVSLVPEIGIMFTTLSFPLYFLSGIMWLPILAPPDMRPYLLINPIIHGLEVLRAPFFAGYKIVPGANLGYLAAWGMVSLLLGLVLHVRFANKMVTL